MIPEINLGNWTRDWFGEWNGLLNYRMNTKNGWSMANVVHTLNHGLKHGLDQRWNCRKTTTINCMDQPWIKNTHDETLKLLRKKTLTCLKLPENISAVCQTERLSVKWILRHKIIYKVSQEKDMLYTFLKWPTPMNWYTRLWCGSSRCKALLDVET